MKLGNYTHISISVRNLSESIKFYETLGFYKIGENTYPIPWALFTDGVLNISLSETTFHSPSINYFSLDVASRIKFLSGKGLIVEQQIIAESKIVHNVLSDPDGFRIALLESNGENRQPNGISISQCGTFRELSIPVTDFKKSVEFWRQFDFETLVQGDAPYLWAMLTDRLMTVGLHQSGDLSSPAFTYFSPDSIERIALLKENGIQFQLEIKDDKGVVANAIAQSPDGQLFFIFNGAV